MVRYLPQRGFCRKVWRMKANWIIKAILLVFIATVVENLLGIETVNEWLLMWGGLLALAIYVKLHNEK